MLFHRHGFNTLHFPEIQQISYIEPTHVRVAVKKRLAEGMTLSTLQAVNLTLFVAMIAGFVVHTLT